MTDEVFLRTIQEKPDDDVTRLIYADWLSEREDEPSANKAAFIRTDCELAALPEKDKRRPRLKKRRRQLAERLPADWLAVVSKLPIEQCSFAYECPLRWENLRAVEDSSTTRFCDKCKKNVYYCDTIEQARNNAFWGHCVAVDVRLTRKKGDLDQPSRLGAVMMGRLLPSQSRAAPSPYQVAQDE